ncbi:MAG: hypothetical protein LBI19_01920 [Oscillospiraceae bacterium]|jgi:flagellar motility protein MotE (MotC chaperone)|nr:hypothetical protein [Oscillospiraceae bacterium]
MAAAVKEKPAKAGEAAPEDMKKAQTVDEMEKEALGPKKPKAEKQKEPKEKRKPGMAEAIMLTSLLWLSIFSAFILLAMFDPTEDRIIRGLTLLLLNPEEETREQYWARDIYANQDLEKELNELSQRLDAFEEDLNLREQMLDERENDLEDREIEVEDWLEIKRGSTASGGNGGETGADLAHMAKTIERMTPSAAATGLAEMDFESAVRVCKLIGAKKLAPIFNAMDPEFFVELMNELTALPEEDDWDYDW